MAWLTKCRRCGEPVMFHPDPRGSGLWEHENARNPMVAQANDQDHDPVVSRFWRIAEALVHAPRWVNFGAEEHHNDRSKTHSITVGAFYCQVEVTFNRPWDPPEE